MQRVVALPCSDVPALPMAAGNVIGLLPGAVLFSVAGAQVCMVERVIGGSHYVSVAMGYLPATLFGDHTISFPPP